MKRLMAIITLSLAFASFAERDTAIYRGKLTSDLNANGNRVTNAAPPVADGDIVNKAYVDSVATNGIRSVDGAARTLPKYLHERSFDSSYPDEAQEYYRSRGDGKVDGGCSAVRDGNFLCRNFDYPFDERAEFVVKMSAGPNRFASVGVAQVGTNLTEQFVVSGKPSRCYKWLPGATVDGVNEKGVVAEINVVDGDPQTSGWYNVTGDLHPLAAVRWALDNGTSAGMVASNLSARIAFPSGWTQNFHYMVADEESTYIVENGSLRGFKATIMMTNGRMLPSSDPDGTGLERYLKLLRGANITNVWYTNAYRRETNPPWVSDLREVISHTNDIFDAWAAHDKEYFRGKTNNGIPWWQTVHTSVYDISNRVLRVAVQETDDWYTFAVPSAGGVKPDTVREIVKPMIDAATNGIPEHLAASQSGKRDLTDRRCFHTVFVLPPDALPITGGEHDGVPYDWSSYSISDNGELLDATCESAGFLAYWSDKDSFVWSGGVSGLKFGGKEPIADEFPTAVKRITSVDNINVIANRDRDANNALAKFNAFGNLVAASASDIPHDATKLDADDPVLMATAPSVDASATSLAGAKATGEALANKADKFTEWEYDYPQVFKTPPHYVGDSNWACQTIEHDSQGDPITFDFRATGEINATELRFRGNGPSFTATRKRVLYTSGKVIEYELDSSSNRTAVTIGSRGTGVVGPHSFAHGIGVISEDNYSHAEGVSSHAEGVSSHAEGYSSHAEGYYSHAEGVSSHAEGYSSHTEGYSSHAEGRHSHAEGYSSHAEGYSSHAEGRHSHAEGDYSHAEGYYSRTGDGTVGHDYAFAWQGVATTTYYNSHGKGTFNINPVGGPSGFWIGETNMADHITNLAPRPSATDPTFSNAVFEATVNSPHLDPVVLRSSATNITVTSHAITTYLPNDTPPHTVEMTATGTRNYKVFIPNEATVRSGLPFEIVAAATAETLGVAWTNEIERLPAMVTVSEPMPGTLIGSVEVFDTGFDWSPSVTSATYDGTLLRVTGEKLHVVRAIRVGTDTSDVSERTYSLVSAPIEASVGSSGVLLDVSGNEVGTFTVTED